MVYEANTSQSSEPQANLDCHIDIFVVREHCLVVHDYDHPVNMSGYDPHSGAKKYRTVSAAVAWTHPQTGQMHMLMINQAGHVPYLQTHL